jgi:hypothetical protein
MITPKPKLKNVSFRLPEDVRAKVLNLAVASGVNESEVYRSIVADFFSPLRQQQVDRMETHCEDTKSA